MISFRRFLQLEARKNAHVNVKKSINDNLYEYYMKSPTLNGRINAFVSFTQIAKLGINPQSKYDTPLGIYAYPIEYVLKSMGKNTSMEHMEFAGDAPYSNAFQAVGNIIDIGNLKKPEYKGYLTKIKAYWKSKMPKETDERIESFFVGYGRWDEREGYLLWKITHDLSSLIGRAIGKSSSVIWNDLFRAIGIDGVTDYGNGIIHPNEETQCVVFHIKATKNVTMFDNKYSPEHTAVGIDKLDREDYDIDYGNEDDDEDDWGNDKDYWNSFASQNINAPLFPASNAPDAHKIHVIPRHAGIEAKKATAKADKAAKVPAKETVDQYNQRMIVKLKANPAEYKNIVSNHALDLMFVKARVDAIGFVEKRIGKSEEMQLAAIAANPDSFGYIENPTLKVQVAVLLMDKDYFSDQNFFFYHPEALKAALKAAGLE